MDAKKKAWLNDLFRTEMRPKLSDDPRIDAAWDLIQDHPLDDQLVRYIHTIDAILRQVDLDGKVIKETGDHESGVSAYLQHIGHDVGSVTGDFRSYIEAEDASCDILFSFEVWEHIKDVDHEIFLDMIRFTFSGVKNYAAEMHRILKPGGLLVLTTPNACSLNNMKRIAEYDSPELYSPHVKEYAPRTVISLCEDAGFELAHFETFYAFFMLSEAERNKVIADLLKTPNFDTRHRGDDSFFVFRK